MAFDDYLGAERKRLQDQQPQAPAYMFRDDRNADLDRTQSAQTTALGVAAKAAGPFAPAKPGAGFDSFSKDLEAGAPTAAKAAGSNPFAPADTKGQVSGAISRLLSNPTGGFDQQAGLAREGAIKKDQQANEDLRGAAALQFLPGTGQAFTGQQQQTDAQRLGMRDFDRQVAGQRADAEQRGLQAGVSAGLQQEGQRISAEQAARGLAESQRQFNETLPIQAAQARTAAELGQGNLDVSRGSLALNQELGRGQLGISKEKMAFDKEIGLGSLSLEQQKVANQASQFATQADFQRYALKAGMDQHTADLAWQSNEKEAERKYNTGERLSSQEFTTLINKNNQAYESAQNTLNRTLQLELQGNSQKFQDAQTKAAQAFETAMQANGFNQTAALQASQQVFQKEMQVAGFTQEQAMQATALAQQANLAKQQMDLQETLHMADLAQNDRQFGQRMGLDYTQLAQQKEQFQANLAQSTTEFAKTFGLQEAQVQQAMARQEVQDALERAQIGMELTKNNPEAMKPFAEQMAREMGKALGFSPEQIEAGIKSGALTANGAPAGTAKAGVDGFSSIVDRAGGFSSPAESQALKDFAVKIANQYASAPAGQKVGGLRDTLGGATMDAAIARLKAAGVPDDTLRNLYNRDREGDGLLGGVTYQYKGTPEFINYTLYTALMNKGLSQADAKNALASLIGQQKAAAALALGGEQIGPAEVGGGGSR